MNLLKIQDALKNASDDQLMQLMQSPDSSAPSFLVLSELRRRKEMRAQQGESPDTTVAEDLASTPQTYGDREGIRSLRVPGYEDEARAEQGDQSGIEAMREGGVVRMQGGGDIPMLPTGPADINAMLLRNMQEQELNNQLDRISQGQQRESERIPLITSAMRDVRALINSGMSADEAVRETLGSSSYRGRINPSDLGLFSAAPSMTTPASQTPPAANATPSAAPAQNRPEVVAPLDPGVAPPPAAAAPPAAAPSPAEVAAAGLPRSGGGGAPSGGLGTLREAMQRNSELFPDAMGGIRDRLREMRTDPASRKNEAINMALIEAGLRMAGSNNPRFIGALSEGAVPAVQGYSRELGQIRQEQRQDIRDEMAVAKSELERMYAIGQISAAEYRTRMQELGAAARAAASESGANARLLASERAADARERLQAQRLSADADRREQADLAAALRNPQLRAQVEERIRSGRPRGQQNNPVTESEINAAIRGFGFRVSGAGQADPLGIR